MDEGELDQIIESQVKAKVRELSTWQKVRWEGGRLYYEATKILHEIREYDSETKILYLEKLLSRNYVIQDNCPHSAPDITNEFKSWILKAIAKIKVSKLQEDKRMSLQISLDLNKVPAKKKRPGISYKVKTILQKEVNSMCPFCSNQDVDHFQIHHIDENPENNSFANLLMVCPNCHSKITKGDISQQGVVKIKQALSVIKIK